MPSDFWVGVAQSAIGSGLGFLLGIFAFHYQQKRQSAKKDLVDWRAALDALNRLTTAAGANIESLVNAKLQFLDDLLPEAEAMKAATKSASDLPIKERTDAIQKLVDLSGSLRHLYLNFQRNYVMLPPKELELSSLSKDMPALSLFVHRAMGMMQEINEQIESRNALIAELARESGSGKGLGPGRVLYYSSLLSDQSASICEHTDFALDLWRLVLDQIKAYKTAKCVGEHVLEFSLVPKAAEAMPKEELFPLMREQLTTFSS